jgi:hypothetical protein
MAFLAQTSGQKGILWWARNHRASVGSCPTTMTITSRRLYKISQSIPNPAGLTGILHRWEIDVAYYVKVPRPFRKVPL